MKTATLFFFLLSIVIADVITLNDANFEEKTQMTTGATTGRWFVKFYAPWCGHCKRLAPTWEELAEATLNEVNVAEVDATQNPQLSKLYNIQGFPTLLFFDSGKYATYNGGRDLESLKDFVHEGYKSASFTNCPSLPSWYETFIQDLSQQAGRHLGADPFVTCFALMGSGMVVGIVATLVIHCCCCRKPRYEPVSDEKKNDSCVC